MFPQLLGELILDRHNFAIMTKYISKPENLKLMMNLLRDKSPNIQFEAFHVFKVNRHEMQKGRPFFFCSLKLGMRNLQKNGGLFKKTIQTLDNACLVFFLSQFGAV